MKYQAPTFSLGGWLEGSVGGWWWGGGWQVGRSWNWVGGGGVGSGYVSSGGGGWVALVVRVGEVGWVVRGGGGGVNIMKDLKYEHESIFVNQMGRLCGGAHEISGIPAPL